MANAEFGSVTFNPPILTVTGNGTYDIVAESYRDSVLYWYINDIEQPKDGGEITIQLKEESKDYCVLNVTVEGVDFERDFEELLLVYVGYDTAGYLQYENVANILLMGEEPVPVDPEPPIIPDEPDPESPTGITAGILTSHPTSITFDSNSSVSNSLKITTSKDVVSWAFDSHYYLNVTTTSTSTTETNFSISTNIENDNEKWANMDFVVKAYYDEEKTVMSSISIPVAIKGNKIIPIWRDEIYIEEANGTVNYKIVNGNTDEIIYAGNAKNFPDVGSIQIHINKIVRGYINSFYSDFGNKKTTLTNYAIPFNIVICFLISQSDKKLPPVTIHLTVPVTLFFSLLTYFFCF